MDDQEYLNAVDDLSRAYKRYEHLRIEASTLEAIRHAQEDWIKAKKIVESLQKDATSEQRKKFSISYPRIEKIGDAFSVN